MGAVKLVECATDLNAIMESDPDPFCRDAAMIAAGKIRSSVNLPTLLKLANEPGEPTGRLVWALKEFGSTECAPPLQKWFDNRSCTNQVRVVAAWGLAALGNSEAEQFLIEMLDDPYVNTPDSFSPGVSLRAAEALAAIHGWPFRSYKGYVSRIKERVRNRNGPEAEGAQTGA